MKAAETGYKDRDLNVLDRLHYHEYKIAIDSTTKKFTFDLPKSDGVMLFVSTSDKSSLLSLISAEEQSNPPRYIGGCNMCDSTKLQKAETTTKIKLEVGFETDFSSNDSLKAIYVIIYVLPKEEAQLKW